LEDAPFSGGDAGFLNGANSMHLSILLDEYVCIDIASCGVYSHGLFAVYLGLISGLCFHLRLLWVHE